MKRCVIIGLAWFAAIAVIAETAARPIRQESAWLKLNREVAMAGPHRWIATTPSNWQASSFDTNLLPASNEVVRFDGTGQGDVIGGLNQTTIDLDLLEVHDNYHGNIGDPGNPLIISADQVIMQGRGTLNYQDGDGTTDLVIVQSDNPVDAMRIMGGTVTRLRANAGRVVLGPSFSNDIDDLELAAPMSQRVPPSVVSQRTASTGYVRLRMAGGYLERLAPGGLTGETSVISGGVWKFTAGAGSPIWLSGGLIQWDTAITSPGVSVLATAFYISGGTLDARAGGAKAISSLYLDPAGQFLYNDDTMSVTSTKRMEP